MRGYFGDFATGLPAGFRDLEQMPTPVGCCCGHCEEEIDDGDDGVVVPFWTGDGGLILRIDEDGVGHKLEGEPVLVFHYECSFRSICGGVNHQLGRCHCCGGTEDPDPPHLTRREAALAATRLFEQRALQNARWQ